MTVATTGTIVSVVSHGTYIFLDDRTSKRFRVRSVSTVRKGERVSVIGTTVVGSAGGLKTPTVLKV